MDLVRSLPVFDPAKLNGAVCTIIGCGAVGSAVFLQLAKLGVEQFVLFDADYVAAHNIGNQLLFGPNDVGKFKVDAATRNLRQLIDAGMSVQQSLDFVTEPGQLDVYGPQHVFVCVDTMVARSNIHQLLKLKPWALSAHESRISPRTAAVYSYDPRDLTECKRYADTLYSDADVLVETAGCGSSITMLPTVLMGAGTLVWNFINTVNGAPVNLETAYATDTLAVHASRPLHRTADRPLGGYYAGRLTGRRSAR